MGSNQTSKLFSILIAILFAESIGLAFVYNTFAEAFVIGLPTLLISLYFFRAQPEAKITRHVAALSLMIFASLHIHQMNGLIEIHFEIFILLAFLIMFSDWQVFISAIALVAVHHFSFYYMQLNNMGVYIFDEERLIFSTVLIHAVYAIVEAVIAGFIAKQMYESSLVGKELSDVTQRITINDNEINLSVRCEEGQSDVLKGFNTFLASIEHLISDIKNQATVLSENAHTLLSAKDDLEHSSTQRQLETDSIATSTEEMAVTVASIAEETSRLSDRMLEAKNFTHLSLEDITEINNKNEALTTALEKTSVDVNELSNSTEAITGLLNEITGIADQTNLLALNAAIEAARAGEQGRGFAVVADEVRALANRTKTSTDKIGETLGILSSYSKVTKTSMESCIKVVADVKATSESAAVQIDQASSVVESSSEISSSVAAAVEEQSTTTNGIAQSIENLRGSALDDMEKINVLSNEAHLVQEGAAMMESNSAKFK